jgi:hypothetical protein
MKGTGICVGTAASRAFFVGAFTSRQECQNIACGKLQGRGMSGIAAWTRFSTTRAGIPKPALCMKCGNGVSPGRSPWFGRVTVCQAQSNALMNSLENAPKCRFQSELGRFSTFPA